jgi:chromosome partitioning protein
MAGPHHQHGDFAQAVTADLYQKVLTTIIPRNVDIRDAHFTKQDIFTFNGRAKAAQRMIV